MEKIFLLPELSFRVNDILQNLLKCYIVVAGTVAILFCVPEWLILNKFQK